MGRYADDFFGRNEEEIEPPKDEYLLAAVFDLITFADKEWSMCQDKTDSEAFLRKIRKTIGVKEIHPYDVSWAEMRRSISLFLQINNLP